MTDYYYQLREFKCSDCDAVVERCVTDAIKKKVCKNCGGKMHRVD